MINRPEQTRSKKSLIMEVMEEGNLMDRIPILLQRDMEYYEVTKNCKLGQLGCVMI